MFVGLILDVILKPQHGKHHRFRWLAPPRSRRSKRRLAPLGRFREILRFARKRGSQHYASTSKLATPEFARRLRLTLEDCGGMFVKFGQIASTRSDLLPETITTELAQLQSAARPVDADEVREVLERELGASVEEEFASFDFEPLAAASIGQTHRAVLKTGEHVVVKVQRPGIEDVVHRDAAVLRMAAGFVERRVEAAHQLGVKRLAEELITSLERELDYGAEAASGIAFLEHLEDDDGIAAPKVYQSLSTRRVLVMEEIHGVTVADHAAVEAAPRTGQRARGAACCSRSSTRCCATACTTPTRTRGTSSSTPRACSGSSTSARSVASARWCSSRCRRWRSASSSTTRSCWPARPCTSRVATKAATAARSKPTSAWCSPRASARGASTRRR